MKNFSMLIAAALVFAGCASSNQEAAPASSPTAQTSSSEPKATTVAYDLGSKKKGDRAVCVVCNANGGGTAEEEVAGTVDYEGKTYAFCSEGEMAEFISNPKKYVKS